MEKYLVFATISKYSKITKTHLKSEKIRKVFKAENEEDAEEKIIKQIKGDYEKETDIRVTVDVTAVNIIDEGNTCPMGYSHFLQCLKREPPFVTSYRKEAAYCSDKTCPYDHHKPRKKLKKEHPEKIRNYKTVVYFEIDNGPNTEAIYYGWVTREEIQKDYENWLSRYIYSSFSYDERGEVVE